MKYSEADRDYYSVLGAEEQESRDEIERRYKRLAREHHPDCGGDEEEMKSLNEAWGVLGDAEARRIYDEKREQRVPYEAVRPVRSPSAQADALGGRIAGSLLCFVSGLALLFLVRFQYVFFLWPLALLGVAIVLFGVMMAHGALSFARENLRATHPARRYVWAQEVAFWSCIFAGAYGVYMVLRLV